MTKLFEKMVETYMYVSIADDPTFFFEQWGQMRFQFPSDRNILSHLRHRRNLLFVFTFGFLRYLDIGFGILLLLSYSVFLFCVSCEQFHILLQRVGFCPVSNWELRGLKRSFSGDVGVEPEKNSWKGKTRK